MRIAALFPMAMSMMAGLVLSTSCETVTATTAPLPRARASECSANCAALDMELGAVVVMMNHAGCVCQPRGAAQAPTAARGAAAIAGGAVIAVTTAQQQRSATASNLGRPH